MKHGTHATLAHADSLRAIRDRNFNEARAALLDWLAANEAPTWIEEATRYVPQWKSPKLLVRLVHAWSRERFAGDAAIFATLDAWRRQDRHLYQWAEDERTKALSRRREGVRVWAAQLEREYAWLITEAVDMSKGRKNAKPENDDASGDYVHRTANEAAPGAAREIVRGAFAGRHTKIAPAGRATKCPVCGAAAIAGDYSVACATCGADLDADHARCWHILSDAGKDTSAVEREWRGVVAAVAAETEGRRWR